MKWNNHVANVTFKESKQRLIVSVIANIILILILISPAGVQFITCSHAHFALLSAIFIFVAQRTYNWKNQTSNWLIFGFYLLVIIVEVAILGLPEGVPINGQDPKGILLQIAISLAPLVYVFARFFTAFPILNVLLKRKMFWKNELV
jgi:hypothetical protein